MSSGSRKSHAESPPLDSQWVCRAPDPANPDTAEDPESSFFQWNWRESYDKGRVAVAPNTKLSELNQRAIVTYGPNKETFGAKPYGLAVKGPCKGQGIHPHHPLYNNSSHHSHHLTTSHSPPRLPLTTPTHSPPKPSFAPLSPLSPLS